MCSAELRQRMLSWSAPESAAGRGPLPPVSYREDVTIFLLNGGEQEERLECLLFPLHCSIANDSVGFKKGDAGTGGIGNAACMSHSEPTGWRRAPLPEWTGR